MNNNSCAFVDVATFDGRMEAEGLKSALERQWMKARVVVEGGWGRQLFSRANTIVHVQVPEDCYDEACKYLSPVQMA